ncbi:MAG: signal peptidase II [Fimbriimonadaceae bacterium]
MFLILTIGLLVLDQVVKIASRNAVGGVEGKSISSLWTGVFELKLVYNEGIAFGMFQGAGVVLTPIAIIITGLAAWMSYKNRNEPKVMHITMALLASGAIGNLYDRLFHGKVTDMFWIRLIDFPVFNIADVCITAAGTLMVLGALSEMFTKKPSEEPVLETEADVRADSGAEAP